MSTIIVALLSLLLASSLAVVAIFAIKQNGDLVDKSNKAQSQKILIEVKLTKK